MGVEGRGKGGPRAGRTKLPGALREVQEPGCPQGVTRLSKEFSWPGSKVIDLRCGGGPGRGDACYNTQTQTQHTHTHMHMHLWVFPSR